MDPSWVILSHCEPWKIAQNEAPPAMVTVHAPEGWEEDIQTKLAVKFHGQPPPDAPGSGRRSGGGGHRKSQEVSSFPAIFRPFSGHFRPPHSFFPPFLDLLNSSTRSLFADSSPFGSYNKNKIGRSLDRVFRPPQRLFDQGNGTIEFLVSWAFH